jgi:hypothetical protein
VKTGNFDSRSDRALRAADEHEFDGKAMIAAGWAVVGVHSTVELSREGYTI